MRSTHLARGAWVLAILVPAALSYPLVQDVRDLARYEPVSIAEQEDALDDVVLPPPPDRTGFADYELVKRGLVDLDWTGRLPEVVAAHDAIPTGAPPPPAVRELLGLLYVQVDPRDHGGSQALVRWVHPSLARAASPAVLAPGDRLPAPHEGVRVHAVALEGVTFVFDDDREEELVVVPARASRFGFAASGTAGGTAAGALPLADAWPRASRTLPDGAVLVGLDEAARWRDGWTSVLDQEVRHRPGRDGRTGERRGLELTWVAPGGLAAGAGLGAGDVLLAVNDRPVTTVAESVTYWRNRPEPVPELLLRIENRGVQRTQVLHLPPSPSP